jgi:hypothetical protein
MTAQEFIAKYSAKAKELYYKFGILPSVTLAAGLLESGNGNSGLTTKANNAFGMKGTGTAGSITLPTYEEVNGQKVKVLADFRAYNNIGESFDDYGKLIGTVSRYSEVKNASSYKGQTSAIAAAGYATDSSYASKLNGIIIENQLFNLDTEVKNNNYSSGGTSSGGIATGNAGTSEGYFNLEPSGWKESISEWIKSFSFVIIGVAVLVFGIYFLFGSKTNFILKEVSKNE